MKIIKIIAEEFENYLCTILMSAMVTLLFIQVVARYFFGTGVDWSEELSRFIFVWLVVWSVAYISKFGGHIRVKLFFRLLPQRLRLWVFLLGELIWITFNVIVIYEGVALVVGVFQFPMISPTVRINVAWIYIAIPLGFFFCTLRMVQWYWLNRGENIRRFLEED